MSYFEACTLFILSATGFKYLDGIIFELKKENKKHSILLLYLYSLLIGLASLYGFYLALTILKSTL